MSDLWVCTICGAESSAELTIQCEHKYAKKVRGLNAAPAGAAERLEPADDLKVAGEAMTLDDADDMLDCITQILDEHSLNGTTHCHMIRWKLRALNAAPAGAADSLVGALRECVVEGRDSVTPDLLEEAADALALKDAQIQTLRAEFAAHLQQCPQCHEAILRDHS